MTTPPPHPPTPDAGQATHTPGPWRVMNHRDLVTSYRYEGAYEILNAVQGEHEANQRVMEAAPDLLAACKALVSALENVPYALTDKALANCYRAAHAAIRKAETGGAP